jgi:hypothetical protein
MPENLGKADEIVVRVSQELMRHRVAEQVWMQANPSDRRILIAK